MHGYTDKCKVTSWKGTRLHHGKVQGDIMISHSYTIIGKVQSWLHGLVQGYIMGSFKKEQGYILCILYCNRKEQRYIKGRCKITSWTGASLHLRKVKGHITGSCKVALRKDHGYTVYTLYVQGYIIGRCKITS